MSTARRPARKKSIEDQVTDDLDAVAHRVVEWVFTPGNERAIPALTDLARKHFPDQWPDDVEPGSEDADEVAQAKSRVLAVMLRVAADRLEDRFGNITAQEAALRLFNLDGGTSRPDIAPVVVYGISGTRYSEIRGELLKRAGLTNERRDRPSDKIRVLRQSLAKVLTDPAFPFRPAEPVQAGGVLVVRSTLADEYVPRPDYEQAIRELRDAGESHVWLWGDAGTGKTRLARAANRDRIVERAVPVLTASNEQTLLDQFADLVVKSGIDPADVNSGNRKAWFIAQLNKELLPSVLVFDDIPPDRELIRALTSTQGSFIIFTSIEHPPPPPDGYAGPELEVRDMTVHESEQMIRSRLPDAQDGEVHQLNVTLAGRPLAVEHSCSFLRETGMSVAEYCTALARQPARTLDAAGGPHGRTLTKVYELILGRLADSPDTLRMLDSILFTQPGLLNEGMLSYLWVDNLGIPSAEAAVTLFSSMTSPDVVSLLDAQRWPGVVYPKLLQIPYVDPIETVNIRAALRRLVDFGLIRSDDRLIVMHQLTRVILGALRQEYASGVFERIKETAHELLIIDKWEPGEPLQRHLLAWAPHVAKAVAQIDATAPGLLAALTCDKTKELALLGAMVVRAYLQMGVSSNEAVRSVQHLYGLVGGRALGKGYDDDRKHLMASFFGLYHEIATIFILDTAFNRELDGTLFIKGVTSEQARMANGIRLEYDTEWELTYNFVSIESSERYVQQQNPVTALLDTGGSRLKNSADTAMLLSRIYYDHCRWNDAIGALEHAYSCYIKIGGDIGAIRGAIDAARRLARVYLRAGPGATSSDTSPTSYLDEATEWLMRAGQVRWRRSDAILNGEPSRFRLRDVLLDTQLNQVTTQIDLTRQALGWDDADTEFTPEELAQFASEPYQYPNGGMSAYSRLDETQQALALLQRIRGRRLVPEFKMQLARLYMLANDPRAQDCLTDLETWFSNDKLSYQTDLLHMQGLIVTTPMNAMLFMPDAADALAQVDQLDQVREQMQAVRDNPTAVSDRYYTAARTISTHHNPYWYTRGLVAALIIGMVTDRERPWIDGLRAELDQAAARIGRTDWIDRANSYGDTNAGLWLYGY